MNITERERHVRKLMTQHGVGYVPFVWGRGKRQMGCVTFSRINGVAIPQRLVMSKPFAEITTDAEFTDTVLHEIAHILAGRAAGHGPKWRSIARSIGCKGTRCSVVSKAPERAVTASCPTCGKQAASQHRLPTRVYYCSPCRRKHGKDLSKSLLTWYRKGEPVAICAMPSGYQSELRRHMAFYNFGG